MLIFLGGRVAASAARTGARALPPAAPHEANESIRLETVLVAVGGASALLAEPGHLATAGDLTRQFEIERFAA